MVKISLGGTWNQIPRLVVEGPTGYVCNQDKVNTQFGKGDKTLFWLDVWAGNLPLKARFPLIFSLETKKDVLVIDCFESMNGVKSWIWRWRRTPTTVQQRLELEECVLLISNVGSLDIPDVWNWKGVDGSTAAFLTKKLRWEIDNVDQQPIDDDTWHKWVPIKVNCFIWHLVLDRIASKEALSVRGVNVGELGCVLCGLQPESSIHLMVNCSMSRWVWSIILNWIKVPYLGDFGSVKELLEYPGKHKRNVGECQAVKAIAVATCWAIWIFRNDMIFNQKAFSIAKVINDIKVTSFLWVKHRGKIPSLDWEKWSLFFL
ncbi:uncharacterized protein LOC143543868 [Bidens hawaiensis]|uniref:uncharacterized protein LOC143543868 n=1 Tax=Bidens hawaiensis TaxID=980011 RepID=UPI00404902D2